MMHRNMNRGRGINRIRRTIARGACKSLAFLAVIGMMATPFTRAANNLYWDTDGINPGSGPATGTWGVDAFWNTDPLGANAGTFQVPTLSINDLHFCAGFTGTSGTVTVDTLQTANSINIDYDMSLTLAGGGAIALGDGTGVNSGIFVSSLVNSSNIIGTPLTLGSPTTTIQNSGNGLLTLSGGITGTSNLILNNNGSTSPGITISTASLNHVGTVTNSGTGTGGVTISSVIGTNVTQVIQNSATSALTLSGVNVYTGGTTITAGTVIITAESNLGAVTAPVTIDGGTLQENTAFNMSASRQILIGANGATFNNNATAGNFNVGGVIKDLAPGAGALNITGSGTTIYVPVAQNTYTGGTHLTATSPTAFTTTVVNSNSVGSATTGDLVSGPFGTGILYLDGGKMRPSTSAPNIIGNAVHLTADTNFILGSTTTLTFNGPVTLTGTRTITQNSPGNIIFSGAIGDGGSGFGLILGSTSTNTLVLAGPNTYTGPTTIDAGILSLDTGGKIADASAITINGGAASGTFQLNGGTINGAPITANAGSTFGGVFLVKGNANLGVTGSPVVTIAGGPATSAGVLSTVDGTLNTLTINTLTPATPALVIGNATDPAILNFEAGAVTSDRIVLTTGTQATINPGGARVVLSILNGYDGGLRTLVTSPTTDLTTGGVISLDTTTGSWGGYQLSMNVTAGAVTLTGTASGVAAPATAYFKGSVNTLWSSFGNGAALDTNFASDPDGLVMAHALPAAGTDVHFVAGGATNLATTLGQNFTIRTLTVDATATSATSIAGGGGILTISPATPATGILISAGAAAHSISAPIVLGASQTWTNSSASSLTVSGAISGPATSLTIVNSSTGSTVLSGANTFGGGLILNSTGTGALTITDTTNNVGNVNVAKNSLGTGTVTLTAGTLNLRANGDGTANAQTLTYNNPLIVNGTATINADYQVSTGGTGKTLAFPSLSIGAGNTLNAQGSTHSYTLNVGNVTLNSTTGGTSTLAVAPNTNVWLTAGNVTGTATAGNTDTLMLGGVANTANSAITGVISDGVGGGKVALSKSGNSLWALTGSASNTYTGGTTVLGSGSGVLTLAKTGGAIAIPGYFAFDAAGVNGAIVEVGTVATAGTIGQQFSAATVINFINTTSANHAYLKLFGNNQVVAGLNEPTADAGVVENSQTEAFSLNSVLTINNSADFSFAGYLRNYNTNAAAVPGTLSIIKTGSGKQTLIGSKVTYTGPTTLSAGTLELNAATNFASSVGFSALSTGTLQIAGATQSISGLSSVDAVNNSAFVQNAVGTNSVLTINLATNASFGGVVRDNPAGNTLGLTKNGAGILTLTNIASYTGPTTVTAGTLDTSAITQTMSSLTLGGGTAGTAATLALGAAGQIKLNGAATFSATNNPNGAAITGSGTSAIDLLAGNRTFTVGDSTAAAIDLAITTNLQNGTLTKAGAGVLSLTGNVNLAGLVNSAGTIVIATTTNLNSTPISGAGIFNLGATTQNPANFTQYAGSIINGTLTGTAFLKQGPGTLNLGATVASVATVTVNQGLNGMTSSPSTLATLNLDFTAVGVPTTNFFSPTAALNLGGAANNLVGGGALALGGAPAGLNGQTFASTLVDAGASAVALNAGASGTMLLNLGALSRNIAGTLDITPSAGIQNASNGVVVANPGPAGTLVTSASGTAYATVGGNDWAAHSTDSPGNIVPASIAGPSAATLYTAASSAATFSGNADITASFTATSDSTVNSIRLNTGAFTLTLAGTNTVTTGGILFGSGVSAASSITGGTIVPGAGRELVFISNKPSLANIIGSVLADGTSGATTVTYRGNPNGSTTGSAFDIKANNTYTGPTYITMGRAGVESTAAVTTPFGIGPDAIVYVDGNNDGQLFLKQGGVVANPLVIIGNGFNLAGVRSGAIRLDSTASITPTLTGTITLLGDATIGNNAAANAGSALISGNIGTSNVAGSTSFKLTKALTGVLKLTGVNSQTATAITGGVLNINDDAALGATAAPLAIGTATLQAGLSNIVINAARPITITGTSTIDVGANDMTIPAVISGTGNLIKIGAGKLTLSAANPFTGTFGVSGSPTNGTVLATDPLALGATAIFTAAGSSAPLIQLHIDGPGSNGVIAMPIGMSGNSAVTTTIDVANNGGGNTNNVIQLNGIPTAGYGGSGCTLNVTGSNGYSLSIAGFIHSGGNGGTQIYNPTTASLTIGSLTPGPAQAIGITDTFVLDGTNANNAVTGVIGGLANAAVSTVTKSNTSTWTLSGANTYTGPTAVNGGTLKLGNAAALGGITRTSATADNGTTVAPAAALDLGGQNNINEVIRINGAGLGGNGALINSGAPASIGAAAGSSIASITGASTGVSAGAVIAITSGGGAGATATAQLGLSSASFTINSGTTVYSAAPSVAFSGGGGGAASATAILTGGLVTGITITSPGSNFTSAPTIAFTGGTVATAGTNPTGTGNAANFVLSMVTITNPGSGFTGSPTVSLTSATSSATLTGSLAGVVMTGDSTIGGTGNITLNGILSETGGARTLTKVGINTLALANTNTYTGATLVDAGRLTVSGSIAASSGVTVANTATFEAAATQTVKSLIVNDGGSAEVSGAALKVLTVNALSITGPTGNLNLHKNAMVVDYTGTSPLTDPTPTGIRAAILSAYNGGDWLGKGIGSNEIAASIGSSKRLAVGYVEASDLLGPTGGTWNLGQSVTTPVDGTAVLVRTTLAGDADLSGDVGLNDLLRLANHYGLATAPATSWYDGDFDYSGDVGLNDLLQLANNYGQAMPSSAIPSSSPQFAADMQLAFELAGQGVTSVPEPTGLGLAALAAAAALLRRNRKPE